MTDGDDRQAARSWWANAFDPIENLRAVADVQRFGRRVADDFADMMVAVDTPATEGDRGGRGAQDFDAVLQRLRNDSMRAAEICADLFDGAAATISAVLSRTRDPGDDAGGGDTRAVEVGPVTPGAVGAAIFWVHNSAVSAVDHVRPHCGPLRSHAGDELEADVVTFDPPSLHPLPPRSSCGIEVRVAVPPTAAPANYATLVLVENLPVTCLTLRVVVVAERPER
jgi:hypothetical protein